MDVKLNPSTPGGEGVLASFFNSLLLKKSGTPGNPGTPGAGTTPRAPNGLENVTPEKITMRTAELERLSRSLKKEMDFSQSDC